MKKVPIISYSVLVGLMLGITVPAVQAAEPDQAISIEEKEQSRASLKGHLKMIGGIVVFVIVTQRIKFMVAEQWMRKCLMRLLRPMETVDGLRSILYPEISPTQHCALDDHKLYEVKWGFRDEKTVASPSLYMVMVTFCENFNKPIIFEKNLLKISSKEFSASIQENDDKPVFTIIMGFESYDTSAHVQKRILNLMAQKSWQGSVRQFNPE